MKEAAGPWACHAPSWRWDLTREVDLIEEFARLRGYDRVPETLPGGPGPVPARSAHELEDHARELLVAFGYLEAITYAMDFGRGLERPLTDRFVGMYVNDFTLDYGPRGKRAVEAFLAAGHEAGIIPHAVAVEFEA